MSLGYGGIAISPSRIKVYQTCKAKYYFEYVYKALKSTVPPEVFGAGNVLHSLADKYVSYKYYKNEQPLTEEEYTIEYLINQQKLEKTVRPRIETEYKNIKEFIKKFAFDENVKDLEPEKKISTPYRDNYYFFGYIDLKVIYKNDDIVIIDYKSNEEKGDHDVQLGIYAYSIAKKAQLPLSKVKTGVFYTKFNEYEEQTWNKEELKKVIFEVEKILREAETATEFAKQPNEYCHLCAHRDTCKSWNGNVIRI